MAPNKKDSIESPFLLAQQIPINTAEIPALCSQDRTTSNQARTDGTLDAQKQKAPKGFLAPNSMGIFWRRDPESNRTRRICNPLHNRFAIAPR